MAMVFSPSSMLSSSSSIPVFAADVEDDLENVLENVSIENLAVAEAEAEHDPLDPLGLHSAILVAVVAM